MQSLVLSFFYCFKLNFTSADTVFHNFLEFLISFSSQFFLFLGATCDLICSRKMFRVEGVRSKADDDVLCYCEAKRTQKKILHIDLTYSLQVAIKSVVSKFLHFTKGSVGKL